VIINLDIDQPKQKAVELAVACTESGMVVGLGTGTTAAHNQAELKISIQ
jgi:ribose 5-phosphate isomerase